MLQRLYLLVPRRCKCEAELGDLHEAEVELNFCDTFPVVALQDR